jgi:phage/plasmid primase-like uncharacterized protein
MAAGAPSEAAAYAEHLLEKTLDEAQLALAAYYGRSAEATQEAIDLGMGSVPLPRPDMDPALAAAVGIDPSRLVKADELANLLGGRRADGEELPVSQANVRTYEGSAPGEQDRHRISAMDFCISAPKSVSLAWMAAADDGERAAILQAHRQANAEMLRYVEDQVGIAGIGHNSGKGTERARLGWIMVDHYTARPTVEVVRPDPVTGVMGTELHTVRPGGMVAGDPQLHCHNILLNVMVTESGRLVAMNRDLLKGRIHEFGAVYQALLATNLRRLGIHVDVDQKTKTARIPCIPQRAVDEFSKRSRDGEEHARAEAQARGMVWDSMTPDDRVLFLKGGTRATRRSRRDDLADAAAWRATMARIGWKHTTALQQGPPAPALSQAKREAAAYGAAKEAFDPELLKRAVVSSYDLRTAAARGLIAAGMESTADVSVISRMMVRLGVRQGGLPTDVVWREGEDGKIRVTTKLHQKQEEEVVRLVRAAAADRSGSLTVEEMREAVGRVGVRFQGQTGAEQVETIKKVGQSGRVALFIGAAGVGKSSRVLPPLVDAWKAKNRDVYGISLAWRQANALEEAGIARENTFALTPFLARLAAAELPPEDRSNYSAAFALRLTSESVVVIDELSQIGTREFLDLMKYREKLGFTLVMTGDPLQCASIEASAIIPLLVHALGEQNVPQILTVVRQESAREREIASLFRGNMGDTEESRLGAVKLALEMKVADRTAELVEGGYRDAVRRVAALYMERVEANWHVEGYVVSASAPTNADALDVSREIRRLRRAAGEVGEDRTVLQAQDAAGNSYAMPVAVGDRVRLFARTRGAFVDERGRARSASIGNNGSVLKVAEVRRDGLLLETAKGKLGFVEWKGFRPPDAPKDARLNLAYGDCLTIDSAQGITSHEHISAMHSGSRGVDGRKGYVTGSRHRLKNWLVLSRGMELREVEERRPINAQAPKDRAAEDRAIWDNVARNLARVPIKETALQMLGQMRQVAERAGDAMREGARRAQARVRSGSPRHTLRQRFNKTQAVRTVQALSARLEAAMVARAPLLHRLAQAAAERAARNATPAPPRQAETQAGARPPTDTAQAAGRGSAPSTHRVQVSEGEAAMQLGDALRAFGLQLKGAPVFDGAIHYVPVEGNRGREMSGAYKARPHATLGYVASVWNYKMNSAGYVGRWSALGATVAISPGEAARLHAEGVRKQDERERARVIEQASAATVAQRKVAAAKPAPASHPYLVAKRLTETPPGVLVDRRGNLVVPLQDGAGRIRSVQTIAPDSDKLYLKDAQKIGVFHVMGDVDPAGRIHIVEGLATGATVHQALREPVVVALDTSNLLAVAVAIRERYPQAAIYFPADNDHHLPRKSVPLLNAGKVKAERAAEEVGGRVLLAPELPERATRAKGTDWNDVHALRGLDAVRSALRSALQASEMPAAQARAEPRAAARPGPSMGM